MRSPGSFSSGGRAVVAKRTDASLFWWTILITLLLGITTLSWFFSIYIFAHPEKPLNYSILTKLEKLEPPKQFSALNVPSGPFLTPKAAYAKYFGLTEPLLDIDNSRLKRRYIQNYETDTPTYLRGTYRIYQVRKLTKDDVFSSGLIVRARAHDYPTVVAEFLFPTKSALDADQQKIFTVGDDLQLNRNSTFASLLHVEKLPEDNLCFTLVPLAYGTFEVPGTGQLSLAPPAELNLAGTWPITDEAVGTGLPTPEVARSAPRE